MSRPPYPPHGHPPDCLCSNCHLSSKLFPRGPNDRIILPAIRPTPGSARPDPRHVPHNAPTSPYGGDRARFAPPRPQSTAPREYRQHAPPPPMPAPRGYAHPSEPSSSRRSLDTHREPPLHRPVPTRGHAPAPDRYAFPPPDRPASAMAAPIRDREPEPPAQPPQEGQGNLEWMPPRLKWVKKKERVSHFTPPSQYQGTSFRQYVHDGVSTRNS
ncbi:hypothetical protein B0H15DRAFT_138177 [Mycena belliarum]|uniref:Uncharacterized protein n=1 Tax=Mycena belliarum TaxID=1033014 RepID=A0AAD6TLD6_9AGAR|nr:hypothetical protein B0H15DRAFT_138177 [Mycena belliae]